MEFLVDGQGMDDTRMAIHGLFALTSLRWIGPRGITVHSGLGFGFVL
jgi:hypothetical protein